MVYLVCGSPCSGKSTYVQEHMRPGDIVCDVDRLYSALCFNEEHDSELYAHKVASELRKCLCDIIHDRKGNWKNAYVISIANTREKVEAEKERINADEVVFIDTPIEVCIERAKDRPFYFPWLIEEWYAERNRDEQRNYREIEN